MSKIVMRWCVALAILLCALLVATARVGLHKTRHSSVLAEERPTEAEAPAPTVEPPPYRAETTRATWHPPAAGRRERVAVAQLHGRVLLPPGSGEIDDLGELEVIAEDGARAVSARLTTGGHFALHLPPGRYTLVAETGDLAGATTDVLARAAEEREIDIQLGPAATISGTLRGAAGAEIAASALPVGGAHPKRPLSIEPGKFTIRGLVPGRRYDLTFAGRGVRTATLRSIAAPADGLEVVLATLPIVRGAFGAPPGDSCPIETVSLHGAGVTDDDDGTQTDVGADCRFELTPPEGASNLTVVAEGPGWHLEEAVEIPAQGDPEPICFNPPCRSEQLEAKGKLRVRLDGAPEGVGISVESAVIGSPEEGGAGCLSSEPTCDLEALTPGRTLEVTVSGEGCTPVSRAIAIQAGDNLLSIPCSAQLL